MWIILSNVGRCSSRWVVVGICLFGGTFSCLGFFYKEFLKLGLFLSYFPGGALLARTLHGKRHCNWRVHAWSTLVTCWRKAPTQLAIWPDGASGIGALTGLSVGNQQLQQQQQARQPRCAGKRHSQWRVLLDRKALLPLALRGSSCLYTAFGLKV